MQVDLYSPFYDKYMHHIYLRGGIGGGPRPGAVGAPVGIGWFALGRGGTGGKGLAPLTAVLVGGRGGGVMSGGGTSGLAKSGGGGGVSVGAGPCEGRGGIGAGGPSSPHTLRLGAGTGAADETEHAGRDGRGGGGALRIGTRGAGISSPAGDSGPTSTSTGCITSSSPLSGGT